MQSGDNALGSISPWFLNHLPDDLYLFLDGAGFGQGVQLPVHGLCLCNQGYYVDNLAYVTD